MKNSRLHQWGEWGAQTHPLTCFGSQGQVPSQGPPGKVLNLQG
jgi:hypothetical protein